MDNSRRDMWDYRGLSVRMRHKLYKEWLYIEGEPFVEWARGNDFRTNYGVALRLGMNFEH